MENQINQSNAGGIRAKTIVEVANGPTTPEADAALAQRKTLVVPDILANAGGVTVSYFEWVQNREGFYWPVEDVHDRLHKIMQDAFNAVYDLMDQHGTDMRTAAYAHALKRIGEAIEAGGTQRYFTEAN